MIYHEKYHEWGKDEDINNDAGEVYDIGNGK
jgi:hypothetical protein